MVCFVGWVGGLFFVWWFGSGGLVACVRGEGELWWWCGHGPHVVFVVVVVVIVVVYATFEKRKGKRRLVCKDTSQH